MTKPYIDPTTGQWVGERETRGADGEITRQTEWFNTEAEARRFAQTRETPNKCSACQVPEHNACPLDPGCTCCADTLTRMEDQ